MWRMPNARFELLVLIGIMLLSHQSLAAGAVYANFDSTAGLVLQGYARSVEGKLRIVPAIGGQGCGGAWLDTKQPVENGFDTTFQIRITDKYVYGADGLAFVIQNPAPALGAAGGNIGYGGLTNLLVVKFDDYHWQDHTFVAFDEIGVLAAASPTTQLWDVAADSIASVVKGVVFSDARVHSVRIVYVPDSLQVYLDDLQNPLMTVKVNLTRVMNLDQGRAWVGFTAASGADWQNHDLISWTFDSAGEATQQNDTHNSSQIQIVQIRRHHRRHPFFLGRIYQPLWRHRSPLTLRLAIACRMASVRLIQFRHPRIWSNGLLSRMPFSISGTRNPRTIRNAFTVFEKLTA